MACSCTISYGFNTLMVTWLGSRFVAVQVAVMVAWEFAAPRRERCAPVTVRWTSNLGLVLLNSVFVRLLFPIAAVGAAFGVMFTFQPPFVMELGRGDVGGFFGRPVHAVGIDTPQLQGQQFTVASALGGHDLVRRDGDGAVLVDHLLHVRLVDVRDDEALGVVSEVFRKIACARAELQEALAYLGEIGVNFERLAARVRRDEERCFQCGACTGVCPVQALYIRRDDMAVLFDAEKCTGCSQCVLICPVRAMEMLLGEEWLETERSLLG